jgi:hypothetical protein
MPNLTVEQIDALLVAEQAFPPGLRSEVEINRLLDMRIQAGTEADQP